LTVEISKPLRWSRSFAFLRSEDVLTLSATPEGVGQGPRRLGRSRLGLGEKHLGVGVAATQVGSECAVHQDHARTGATRQRGFSLGPRKDRTPRVGRIGGREFNRHRRLRRRSQRSQKLKGGRFGEPGGTESSYKQAAPHASAFLHRFEHGIDRTESARHVFRRCRLAHEDAVSMQQPPRQRGGPFGGRP